LNAPIFYLSRRGLVATAASVVLAPVKRTFAADSRAAKIVVGTMAIDMHNHVYPAGAQQGLSAEAILDRCSLLGRS
jgi:hypothetical protein